MPTIAGHPWFCESRQPAYETIMSKKKSSNRSDSRSSAPAGQLTKQLEKTDREIVRLLNEHARLVQRLGVAKPDHDASADSFADQQRVDRLLEGTKGPLGDRALRNLLRELGSAARALVRSVRVVYLGPKYSYSFQAAVDRFGESAELSPVATIAAVFEELNRKQAEYGVVPLENSTDGRVADTLTMFARMPVKICGEVQLRIRHNLLAKCPRDQIQEVYSKPQALSQCREWISKHLSWARPVEMTSTAAAAQVAASKPGAAAVASLPAASAYGLDVLATDIEDNKNNVTRFAVIGGEQPSRTGNDKTAVMFEIPHRPGALADVMAVFKRGRLNLTWIESFPMRDTPNEYLFFVELEGHQADVRVKKALAALQRRTVRLEILGSYGKAQPAE
jgi:chorismate mutase / prephenate dehydratase